MGPDQRMLMEMTAAELVAAARGGDLDAFGRLVDRFQGMAHAYARALLRDEGLAEDACQEAWVDAFLHLCQLREDAAFAGWFRRVLIKHADRQRRRRLLYEELRDLPGAGDPLQDLIAEEERRAVREGVAELPERLRSALLAYYGDGLSVGEAAAFLGVAPAAIKKRLFDARVRLRAGLRGQTSARSHPRDAVELLIASRTGAAARVAQVLARRPDLAELTERWNDPDEALEYGSVGRGFTLLQRAVYMGRLQVVRVLLDAGAATTGASGLPPLDMAVLQGEVEISRVLVKHAATVQRAGGLLTPLHRAAMRGSEAIVRLLLGAGADATACDPGGRRPADWARAKGYQVVADLLEES